MPDALPNLPAKVAEQIRKAGLPVAGSVPFVPKLTTNRQGEVIIEKAEITTGPKRGKRGWVDSVGRIWLRDRAHGSVVDHWDVQADGGRSYVRVDDQGNLV
jgi:hypothetical protein